MRGLFQRLDTTPGQEKVIIEAFGEVREAARKAKGEWRHSRDDVAKAIRGENFDAVMMGDMFGRQDSAIEEMRKAMVGALSKVHDALDERQRGILADMVERGEGGARGGPFFGGFRPRDDFEGEEREGFGPFRHDRSGCSGYGRHARNY
ncbi:MAG: hypothetical protein NVS3B20_20130 [Polyangiales bacterium]